MINLYFQKIYVWILHVVPIELNKKGKSYITKVKIIWTKLGMDIMVTKKRGISHLWLILNYFTESVNKRMITKKIDIEKRVNKKQGMIV